MTTDAETMDRVDPVVRFKCTSCQAEGEVKLSTLPEGCQECGGKVLEIHHPTKGHLRIDFRSVKSLRKKRRQRLRAI